MAHPAQARSAPPSSTPSSARLDVMLRLLDHQIVGPDAQLVGNVDDVELLDTGAGLFVTGLAIGPASLAQRLPGHTGDWLYAIWRRLHPDPDPQPLVVPIERVTQVGSAVAVDEYAAKALDDAFGLEQWLRHYVVSRIPGAKGGGDDRNEEQPQPDASAGAGKEGGGATRGSVGSPLRSPLPGATFVGDFVGRRVVDAASQKDVGLVCELHAAAGPLDRPQGPMQITHLQYGRHQRGSELGYNADQKQGPWVVAALVRHWQRENRVVPMVRLKDLGSADRPVVIPNSAGLPHPYDVTDW